MKFHIEHNVTPNHIRAILPLLSAGEVLGPAEILRIVQQRGHHISYDYLRRNLNVLAEFGLLVDDNQAYRLSASGTAAQTLLNFKPSAFYDVMHCLYYTSWDLSQKPELRFSWTYQTICNLLWDTKPALIDAEKLAAELLSIAQASFPEEQRIAISAYAVEGAYHWIRALEPPFVRWPFQRGKRETGVGRATCSPELFILGVDYLYKKLGLPYQSPMLIDESKIRAVCQLCLLNMAKFNQIAELTLKTFDALKVHSGEWGLSLVLAKPIRVEELA